VLFRSGGEGVGSGPGDWTGAGTMNQFDAKVAYGLKPFGNEDQLSSWDAAGSDGYSQGFALWSNNDTATGLSDNSGSGINSNYTPIGLQTESGADAGKGGSVQQGSGGGGSGGGGGGSGGGMGGAMSGGIGGMGTLPGMNVETRNGSTIDQDYEQFSAMRDADPYIGKPVNRMGGGPGGM